MGFDKAFWDEHGYVHIKHAVPREQLAAVIRDLEIFTGKHFFDEGQWYREPMGGGGMVNMAHTQAEWDNRQSPRVYEAFAGIWGQENLFVTINRANFNPPVGPNWGHPGMIHWDLDPSLRPIELRVQGVLYLTDTAEDMGGFQCVPGSHRKLQEWQDNHPDGGAPTEEEIMQGLELKRIAGEAGDLVIWQASLLHGNGKNTSKKPRLAQYICMTPEGTARSPDGLIEGRDDLRLAKVESWRLGPYQREVARAFDIPEAFVEKWISDTLKDSAAVRTSAPPLGTGSEMTPTDRDRLIETLEREKPWATDEVERATAAAKRYGTTASYYPKAVIAREMGIAVQRITGIAMNPEPARLTDLGKRLLGAVPW